jgi:hypothetical protein
MRSLPLFRPGTEIRCMVPTASPRLCRTITARLAGLNHQGSLRSLDISVASVRSYALVA